MFTLSPENVAKTNGGSILEQTLHTIAGSCMNKFGNREQKLAYEQQEKRVWESQRQALFEEFKEAMRSFNRLDYANALCEVAQPVDLGNNLSLDPQSVINSFLFQISCLPEDTRDSPSKILGIEGNVLAWETPRGYAQLVFEFRSNETDSNGRLKCGFVITMTKYKGGEYSLMLSTYKPPSGDIPSNLNPISRYGINNSLEIIISPQGDSLLPPVINTTTTLVDNMHKLQID